MMNKYKNISPIDKSQAEQIFLSDDIEQICNAIVSIAFYEKDWKWSQDNFLKFLLNDNKNLSGLAATSLGHIARIHGKLEKEKVVKALQNCLLNPEISGQVQDALDDIEMFTNHE